MTEKKLFHVIREGNLLSLPYEITGPVIEKKVNDAKADHQLSARILWAGSALAAALLAQAFLKK